MNIEKNFQLPTPLPRYEFVNMQIGDSVFFAGSKSSGKEYTSARMHGIRKGKKFAARNVEGGVRIWRTE